MATPLANWIKESTATTGTGTITLGGAETGFLSFEDHPDVSSTDTVHYVIEDGNDKEYGIGTLTSGASWTLARTTTLATLVSGTYDDTSPTAISLSGSAVVGVCAVDRMMERIGALCTLSAAQTISNTTYTAIGWDQETYDDMTFHDTVTNNSRITIPTGVSRIRLGVGIEFAANSTGYRRVEIYKNGSADTAAPCFKQVNSGSSDWACAMMSPPMDVSASDYFEVYVYHNRGGNLDVNTSNSYFSVEVVN